MKMNNFSAKKEALYSALTSQVLESWRHVMRKTERANKCVKRTCRHTNQYDTTAAYNHQHCSGEQHCGFNGKQNK